MRLGFLPMKNNDAVRPANVITRPDHDVWRITDGAEMREFFQKSFPRFDFAEGGKNGDLVSKKEWDRFAKAQGTKFPLCQYSPGIQESSESGECGVVLVGDALHSFPPDIGQGINAGLEDVNSLDKALKSDVNTSLGSRLAVYETERLPQVRLKNRFCAPII